MCRGWFIESLYVVGPKVVDSREPGGVRELNGSWGG